jgi:hypothetical protein
MKNCPWFSLRSNSIESRFRSIRRGNFWFIFREFKKKQKQLGIRFAHSFFLATLGLGIKLGKFAPIRDALYAGD